MRALPVFGKNSQKHFFSRPNIPAPSASLHILCDSCRLTLWCILFQIGSNVSNISHQVWSDKKEVEGYYHLLCFDVQALMTAVAHFHDVLYKTHQSSSGLPHHLLYHFQLGLILIYFLIVMAYDSLLSGIVLITKLHLG